MLCSHLRSQPACFSGRSSPGGRLQSTAIRLAALAASAAEQAESSASALKQFRGRIHEFERQPTDTPKQPEEYSSDWSNQSSEAEQRWETKTRSRRKFARWKAARRASGSQAKQTPEDSTEVATRPKHRQQLKAIDFANIQQVRLSVLLWSCFKSAIYNLSPSKLASEQSAGLGYSAELSPSRI